VGLAVLNSNVYQFGIFWLLGCGENERGVGGGILGLVFADSCGISVLWLREDGMRGELNSRRVI
jgi:hypothetical protein